jgi:ComF family protein
MTVNNLQIIVSRLTTILREILFPCTCLVCSKGDKYLCNNCEQSVKLNAVEIINFNQTKPPLLYSALYSQVPVKTAIRNFKFQDLKSLSQPISSWLNNYWQLILNNDQTLPQNFLVIPVPLHRLRYLARGFNQAEILAKSFCEHFNYELITNKVVTRNRNTPHQVGLKRFERLVNLIDAFAVTDQEKIKNRDIIIIDDVITTGATIEEIAKVLREAGAKKIIGLSVARD